MKIRSVVVGIYTLVSVTEIDKNAAVMLPRVRVVLTSEVPSIRRHKVCTSHFHKADINIVASRWNCFCIIKKQNNTMIILHSFLLYIIAFLYVAPDTQF